MKAAHPNSHPAYRPDIDGLRAVAIVSVLAFHAAPQLLRGGFVGVDVFFVISGFLITSILARSLAQGELSFVDFYSRRIVRIFPPLLLVLAACLAFGWGQSLDTEYQELGKEVAAGAGFVANLLFWHDAGYFDVASRAKPLLHLWSLGVEEQFYFLWPLMLWLAWRRRLNAERIAIGVGACSLLASVLLGASHRVADFYWPITRFWELMLGAWAATSAARGGREGMQGGPHRDLRSALGLALIVGSTLLMDAGQVYPGWRALAPTLGALLVITAGPQAWVNRKLLASRPMVAIGLISFSLYLWHWPILVFYQQYTGQWAAGWDLVLCVAASLALAVATFFLVERPCRRYRSKVAFAAVLAALMLLVGFAGYDIFARHGLKFRLSHMVAKFAYTQDDAVATWRPHTCFLNHDADFAPQCVDAGSGRLVGLWGDSHAAQLYPGLRVFAHRDGLRVAQFTAVGCPPLLGDAAPYSQCADYNRMALDRLRAARPDVVLLSADWTRAELPRLGPTVAALRSAGIRHVVLVGPTPTWPQRLPKTYFLYWRKYHAALPLRSRFGMDFDAYVALDRAARAAAGQLGIDYESAFDVLCNQQGCLTRTQEQGGTITTWDEGHITPAASVLLVDRLMPQVLAR